MVKQRLDVLLVERSLCSSRALAQRLIQAGEVLVNSVVVDKAGTEVDVSAQIQIKERSRFVSRGGEKLAKAIELFAIPVEGRICLDGGISTGGFTDCLLQAGAKRVYGVDVGYGQVDWRLRNDSRVILKERTNLRYLTKDELYGDESVADLAVLDVSFISLTKILAALWHLLQDPREIVLLVKPQFEVGKDRVGKKGVVRDPKDQANAIFQVLQTAQELGWQYKGLTWSPITGPAGNIEYLLWLGMESEAQPLDLNAIAQMTCLAQKAVTIQKAEGRG
ncbi:MULTISPECIES: TlyA family RNA methyltransferase [Nostocales]|uniref:Hemolysin n=3 Tax=Nostocales TaxID=1161 RepID=A0A0C1R1G8_9CYAN|nr:TlyA family RNA methyltransferase [Tolypothrix bouteillei]KAF3890921.1 TlyA family RNA methyltransferase [Tolypothrix bouteillei VB521301]